MRSTMRLTFSFAGTLAIALLCVAPGVLADDDKRVEQTTTTTTTTQGTVSQVGPNTIVVRSADSATPMTYSQSRTTTYVDENGNPVAVETIKSGAPVLVYYDKSGDKMTATKVVVKKRTVKEDD